VGVRGPNPFEVASSLVAPVPALHRDGLPLLFGSVGLLILVAACGSTLRMLVRAEARVR
jgi:hypothetical protein